MGGKERKKGLEAGFRKKTGFWVLGFIGVFRFFI